MKKKKEYTVYKQISENYNLILGFRAQTTNQIADNAVSVRILLGKFVSSLFAFSRREERFDWLIWQGWNSSSSDSLLSFFFFSSDFSVRIDIDFWAYAITHRIESIHRMDMHRAATCIPVYECALKAWNEKLANEIQLLWRALICYEPCHFLFVWFLVW